MSESINSYHHQEREPHWQQLWEEHGMFQDQMSEFEQRAQQGEALDPLYLLFAFAYPSGSGLHVGHAESKTALDILARYYRMFGKDVFFPVGWDAFGLPAENYAIKTGVPPATTTRQAIDTFRRQIKRIGISYDWASELATCHPGYYKFTQWLFAELFRQGLAYKKMGYVNWCPSCQTVLANEQVVEGLCERCDSEVEQKELEQWYFKITEYKDELIEGLEQVDWPEPTKQQQLNWIGRSEGAEVEFSLAQDESVILPCFTTRLDTIFGTTFLVVSPEKFRQLNLMKHVDIESRPKIDKYLSQAFKKTEEERRVGEKKKTGVDTGLSAINPISQQTVPIFVADYVLAHVGTGVVMGVPAHDERDWAFAKKHDLEIIPVVKPVSGKVRVDGLGQGVDSQDEMVEYDLAEPQVCTSEYGIMVNSGKYDGLSSAEGKQQLLADFPEKVQALTTYKLRDWLISRQRYWGAPIPVIYDPSGQPHLVKDKDLPWLLPEDVDFKPTGESPLVSSQELQQRTQEYALKEFGELIKENSQDPELGWAADASDWRPEYDTMDTFVDSSWYYLRFLDARNEQEFARPERLEQFMPVDFYLIGPEHIVLHLLYSRFFTKFLRDQGYLQLKSGEPFAKMRHQGMILGPDNKKMSKSKGNVINPDDIITSYGADTLRVYEMFMGPLEADKPWNDRAVQGVYRFLNKLYDLAVEEAAVLGTKTSEPSNSSHPELERQLHATIKKVTEDLPELKFNTAIATLMEFSNNWRSLRQRAGGGESLLTRGDLCKLVKLVAPLAPFLAEELWSQLGQEFSVHQQGWPEFDPELAKPEEVVIPVQIDGKLRGELILSAEEVGRLGQDQIIAMAKQLESVQKWIVGKNSQPPTSTTETITTSSTKKSTTQGLSTIKLKKEIYVPGKIVSLVR